MSKTAEHSKPNTDQSWQWDGSADNTEWPSWLTDRNPVVADGLMKITTSAGVMSAVKGEWIVKDAKGHLHVTKDQPKTPIVSAVLQASGAEQSSPQARGSAASTAASEKPSSSHPRRPSP
jgi:hypothetical protein